MELSSIKQYLEKYQKKLSFLDDRRGEILAIIKQVTGISFDEKMMTITKGVITMKASSVVKNELFLYKGAILQKLKEHGRTDIHDIG